MGASADSVKEESAARAAHDQASFKSTSNTAHMERALHWTVHVKKPLFLSVQDV